MDCRCSEHSRPAHFIPLVCMTKSTLPIRLQHVSSLHTPVKLRCLSRLCQHALDSLADLAFVDPGHIGNLSELNVSIPHNNDGVDGLLSRLTADRETVAETSIEGLESEVVVGVYDLLELIHEEREVVEAYLDVF